MLRILNPDDPNVRLAQFGRQVELFLEGDIGTFLIERARSQMTSAMNDLKVVDPYESKEVQKCQNRIVVAQTIIEWLGEAIAAGHESMEELKNAQT